MSKKHTKKNRHRIRVETHYTLMHELTASPTQPIPLKKRTHQLSVMWEGLRAMERDPNPTPNDWRVCSDAVNLMETFITQGPWLDVKRDLPQPTYRPGALDFKAIPSRGFA